MKQKINSLVVSVWKPIGWTPLKAVEEYKKTSSDFPNSKISYAGRLDPMAEGILLLLIDEENKKRHEYEDLEKTYESEIVFGISTDSFDGLGIIENIETKRISQGEIIKCLKTFLGKQRQKYPPYSSKSVNGKSLYWWARNKKLEEINIPERDIDIYSIELLNFGVISVSDLVKRNLEKVNLIEGDFRQDEIRKNWEKLVKENMIFPMIKIRVSCSSGTYVRRIASDLGKKLKSEAFAFSIKRTSVGNFSNESTIYFINSSVAAV